jgi:hypothetical protein
MPRRSIAAVLLFTMAMLLLPCGFTVHAQQDPHACCAPQLQAHSMDCCNSAAPHPAIPQSRDRCAQAIHDDLGAILPDFVLISPASHHISLQLQPSKRIPATILRT